jgi:hypothetical protein
MDGEILFKYKSMLISSRPEKKCFFLENKKERPAFVEYFDVIKTKRKEK